MALSEQDKKEIELTIIKTLNNRLTTIYNEIKEVEKKADRANTRIFLLVGYLTGAGIITVGALAKLFGGA